jgi:hypothetical protein
MTLFARRPSLTSLALLLLLCGVPGRGYADYGILDVSKERARELGITVSSGPSANNDLRVQVEFKTTGPMKEFRWADLELTQGEKRLVTAALMLQKPSPGSVHLEFYGDPAALANATVTLFVHDEPLGGTGYRLKMKDFLTPAASR